MTVIFGINMFVHAGDEVLCVRPVHFNRRSLIQAEMNSSHETVTTILTSPFVKWLLINNDIQTLQTRMITFSLFTQLKLLIFDGRVVTHLTRKKSHINFCFKLLFHWKWVLVFNNISKTLLDDVYLKRRTLWIWSRNFQSHVKRSFNRYNSFKIF